MKKKVNFNSSYAKINTSKRFFEIKDISEFNKNFFKDFIQ